MLIHERLWAEIDVGALRHNFFEVRRSVKPSARICCVVKADAYGHGALELAKIYSQLGADMLAVSNLSEAIELRLGGIKLPVMILGYVPAEAVFELSKYGIEVCIYSLGHAREISSRACALGVSVKAHIKIDTGMGRIGFVCRNNAEAPLSLCEAEAACRLSGIDYVGIFTHFAIADGGESGEAYTRLQFSNFMRAVSYLEARGIHFKIKHCANSAAIFDYPEYAIDMVRAGIVLYGAQPSDKLKNPPRLRQTLTLKSVIANIKTVNRGESVGYGREFTAAREMRVATVPIGYADGLLRRHGKAYIFTVGGKGAPLVGRICMDQTMLDITEIEDVNVGDEVVIFGNGAILCAADMARICETIEHEIFCSVSRRVPRAYIDGEKTTVRDYLLPCYFR